MRQLLRQGRKIINMALSPLGVEVHKLDAGVDLSLYEEQLKPDTPLYVNIGAGAFYHPYWHNLDNPNEYYKKDQRSNLHIEYDLTSHIPMPLADSSIKVAYTSHVIEHISNEDVEFLFREVYRCLQLGGIFRVTCPDMDLEYAAYCRGDASFWRWPNAYGVYNFSIEQKLLDHFATALTEIHPCKEHQKLSDQEVREIFSSLPKDEAFDLIVSKLPKEIQKDYCGDHINWFGPEKVMSMLRRANFSNVYESKYGQSHCPVLRNKVLFDSTCPELSLYIECRK